MSTMTQRVAFRLGDSEIARITEEADRRGVSRSVILREALRKEFDLPASPMYSAIRGARS